MPAPAASPSGSRSAVVGALPLAGGLGLGLGGGGAGRAGPARAGAAATAAARTSSGSASAGRRPPPPNLDFAPRLGSRSGFVVRPGLFRRGPTDGPRQTSHAEARPVHERAHRAPSRRRRDGRRRDYEEPRRTRAAAAGGPAGAGLGDRAAPAGSTAAGLTRRHGARAEPQTVRGWLRNVPVVHDHSSGSAARARRAHNPRFSATGPRAAAVPAFRGGRRRVCLLGAVLEQPVGRRLRIAADARGRACKREVGHRCHDARAACARRRTLADGLRLAPPLLGVPGRAYPRLPRRARDVCVRGSAGRPHASFRRRHMLRARRVAAVHSPPAPTRPRRPELRRRRRRGRRRRRRRARPPPSGGDSRERRHHVRRWPRRTPAAHRLVAARRSPIASPSGGRAGERRGYSAPRRRARRRLPEVPRGEAVHVVEHEARSLVPRRTVPRRPAVAVRNDRVVAPPRRSTRGAAHRSKLRSETASSTSCTTAAWNPGPSPALLRSLEVPVGRPEGFAVLQISRALVASTTVTMSWGS